MGSLSPAAGRIALSSVMSDVGARGWRRGDTAIEAVNGSLVVRHRGLASPEAVATTLDRTSLPFAIFEYLKEPRSDQELVGRFAGVDLVAAVRALSGAGLIFRDTQSEQAYVVRRRAIAALQLAENVSQDLLGFGTALFDDGRSALGETIADELDEIDRRLERVRSHLREARNGYLKEQCRRWPVEPHSGALRLNLGSGRQRIPGWIGIDVQQAELRANLRWGLPFADGAARFVYAAHFLEHLRRAEATVLVAEIHRVLQEGGVLRLVVPDIGACMRAYARRDSAFFDRPAAPWPGAEQGRTRLEQILDYAGAGADVTDLGGHKSGYDFETIEALLRDAGFHLIERSGFNASQHPELRIDDRSPAAAASVEGVHYSLFVEAQVTG